MSAVRKRILQELRLLLAAPDPHEVQIDIAVYEVLACVALGAPGDALQVLQALPPELRATAATMALAKCSDPLPMGLPDEHLVELHRLLAPLSADMASAKPSPEAPSGAAGVHRPPAGPPEPEPKDCP